MARYSSIVKKRKKKNKAALSEPLQAFIARRIYNIAALFFLIGGTFTLLALASYHHQDPSWNTATPTGEAGLEIANWMGLPGAYIADLLMQTIGLGGAIFGIVFSVWGFRLLRRHPIGPFTLRFAALVFASITAAIALALFPAGEWMMHPYLGGPAGTIMLDKMSLALPEQEAHTIASTLAALMALPALLYALAISTSEWASAFRVFLMGIKTVFAACFGIIAGFASWVRHYGDPNYKGQTLDIGLPEFDIKALLSRIPRPEAENKAPAVARTAPALTSTSTPAAVPTPSPAAEKGKSIRIVNADKNSKTEQANRQTSFALESTENWELPPMDLLEEAPMEDVGSELDENALRHNAELLQNTLADFKIEGEIVSIHPGPVVTLYELEPAPGTKTARVVSLSDDIARSMAAVSVRCDVIPGRNVIGIELPNTRRQTVHLRELLEMKDVQKTGAHLPLVLGKDIGGRPVVADLAKMPHLLVAGTTGSGKSVAVNTMILSLLYRLPPEKCRFILIDPKMLELSVYDDIPHLLSPVVTEPGKAVMALKWAVQEMEDRYRAMSKLGVRNIEGYNARLREARRKGETLMRKVQTGYDPDTGKPVFEEQPMDTTELPYIVIVVDEFADLMLVAGKDVENAVQRLAQMARAAGIHLVMATQRPSTDVITGVIKANFPTRISFAVTSKIDSRVILNEGGAEQLLGMGDMLYMAPGGRITRVHGPFVSDEDVESVVSFLKAQSEPSYIEEVTEGSADFGDSEVMAAMFGEEGGSNSVDELYDQAVAIVARERKASTSFIQRHLQIGYNRAARIVEEMERQGVISPANRVGKREVLVGDYSEA